jgi:hypothetical protein
VRPCTPALRGRLAFNPAAMMPGARPVIPRAAPAPPPSDRGPFDQGPAAPMRHAGLAMPGMERPAAAAGEREPALGAAGAPEEATGAGGGGGAPPALGRGLHLPTFRLNLIRF